MKKTHSGKKKLNNIILSLLDKIDQLPDGTEISISGLVNSIYGFIDYKDDFYNYKDFSLSEKEYFELTRLLLKKANHYGIRIYSTEDDDIACGTGLPFHCSFVIKHLRKKNNNLLTLPEQNELKHEVEKLRTEISILVLERDELRYVECRNLETAYMLAVGALEHKAYETQCHMLRLKRKIEMIQAKRNRQEKIILSQIEQALDEEFSEYQKKLNEQIEKMNQAIEHSHGKFLSDEETKEFKKLYRSIVKILHPDLHPDLSDAQKRLFQNAVQAYKNGDLETLRLIHTMSEEQNPSSDKTDSSTELYRQKERLEKALTTIQEEIAKIKSEFPYTMKSFLSDKEKIEEKKKELDSIIQQYQDMVKYYQEQLDKLVR